MAEEEFQKNVLGEKLEACSVDPITGWFRDGCCNTNDTDHGVHTVAGLSGFLWLKIPQSIQDTPDVPEINNASGGVDIKVVVIYADGT